MIHSSKGVSAPRDPMQHMRLPPKGQQQLLDDLASMLWFLAERFGALSEDDARLRDGDVFSPVEQVWHLADLEREGFGVRIERLLNEPFAFRIERARCFIEYQNGSVLQNCPRNGDTLTLAAG